MQFEENYGKSGGTTGEGGLTKDWTAFLSDPNTMMKKYGLSIRAGTNLEDFKNQVKSYSRSVFVCNTYLIVPEWMLVKMRNETVRTCVSAEGERVIRFQMSNLFCSGTDKRKNHYRLKEVNSAYVSRVFTGSDFPTKTSKGLMQPKKWIAFQVLGMDAATREKLTNYDENGRGDKAITKFKKSTGYWFKLSSLKVQSDLILKKCLFAFQKIVLPTPGGGEIEVQLAAHVLPIKFK